MTGEDSDTAEAAFRLAATLSDSDLDDDEAADAALLCAAVWAADDGSPDAYDALAARMARASIDAQRQAMEALGDILIETGEDGDPRLAARRCAALVGVVAADALRPLDDAASALAAMLRADMADEATADLANALSARAEEMGPDCGPGDGLGRCGLALAAIALDRRRRAEAATLARFYAPLIDDPGFLRRLRRDLGPRAAEEARALLALSA